jgi:D-xylose transport system ATP-binding protein
MTVAPTERLESTPLLELRGIVKFFGGVRAVDSVDLELWPREVVAILGDNGAGKSTLIRLISGIETIDAGTIYAQGRSVNIRNPNDAASLGIQTVYQDLGLCDNLDTIQNLYLGRELHASWFLGGGLLRPAMEHRGQAILTELHGTIRSLRLPVGRLSGGQRQSIAVARSLLSDPKLILLDEPTAGLGVAQRRQVLELIHRLRGRGCGVAVVSHDLRDIREVADRVVVLRLGRKVAEYQGGRYSEEDLVAAITGESAAAQVAENGG